MIFHAKFVEQRSLEITASKLTKFRSIQIKNFMNAKHANRSLHVKMCWIDTLKFITKDNTRVVYVNNILVEKKVVMHTSRMHIRVHYSDATCAHAHFQTGNF